MKFDEQTYDLIHDYLAGEMSEVQKAAFEERLRNEPELAEEVKSNRLMINAWNNEPIQHPSENDLYGHALRFLKSDEAEKYRQAIQDGDTSYHSKKKSRPIYYAAAATILIISFIGILFFFTKDSATELTAFYQWDDLPSLTERSVSGELADAEKSFRNGDYETTLQILTQEQENQERNASLFIYIGICHLELQQYEQALEIFTLFSNSNLLDKHQAHWYLTLTHLKMGNQALAIEQLDIFLRKNNNPNSQKARELKDFLNKN